MLLLLDVGLHGLLPIHEICQRFGAGEIPAELFYPALIGRLAQDGAQFLDDNDPMRQHLLSISFQAEDWFEGLRNTFESPAS
jgi:hypothetical protein